MLPSLTLMGSLSLMARLMGLLAGDTVFAASFGGCPPPATLLVVVVILADWPAAPDRETLLPDGVVAFRFADPTLETVVLADDAALARGVTAFAVRGRVLGASPGRVRGGSSAMAVECLATPSVDA